MAIYFTESKHFVDYIKAVKNAPAGWKPPNRHKVYGPLLDTAFDEKTRMLKVRAEKASVF